MGDLQDRGDSHLRVLQVWGTAQHEGQGHFKQTGGNQTRTKEEEEDLNGFTRRWKWVPITKELPCGSHRKNTYLDDNTEWLEEELRKRGIGFMVKSFDATAQKCIEIREEDYPKRLTEKQLLALGYKVRPTSRR